MDERIRVHLDALKEVRREEYGKRFVRHFLGEIFAEEALDDESLNDLSKQIHQVELVDG